MTTRVIVTGATGFVGRTLVPALAARDCDVSSLGRSDARRPAQAVVDDVVARDPEVIVHLATHFLASHTAADIPDLIQGNVEWGAVVAEAAAESGSRLITIGTAWQHVDAAEYSPVSLYSATKQALDDIVTYYVQVRGLRATRITLFDTYGPGDRRPKLVPALFDAMRSGQPLQMSDGGQLIDLTYVDDIARGIADVALDPFAESDVVLRSWRPVTIRQVVDAVQVATQRPVPVEWDARPVRPREMRTDWIFGHSPAGWQASTALEDGLAACWAALGPEGVQT